ncbi:transcriptional regulator medA [Aspergillus homomorphus CBS 101889]|uniref:Transcriptional regulator medusa n=1 Tax=Aspergillus homomorphus (strain CBS 101889) TaxID=1450537 RepID=A0A395HS85_ASPHC|nr:transcriptional regulator medusa [Aspergillus homomorphus CBS 101889]RAL10640.1 transcriptional regulator medusa [Aspergillus homomorphus CBS 101889]
MDSVRLSSPLRPLIAKFNPELQTPLILDESLDFSDPEESQFIGAFSDGLLAKSDPILSMPTFQKPPQAALIDYESARSLQDGVSYSAYGQAPYVTSTPLVPSPMADHTSQISDCVPYMGNQEYASSYEEGRSPMMTGGSRPTPEVVSYTPQRGSEGTRVFVQIQSPFDLHESSYASLYLVFGAKRCECVPHFLGFQGSSFQYGFSVETPPFSSTCSPSYAVPLQVSMDSNDCSATTLQVGVYTYEPGAIQPPSDDFRKRGPPSYSEEPIHRAPKRVIGQSMPPKDQSPGSTASYSPYLHSLPAMSGFVAPYPSASSPRASSTQYSTISATSQPSIRAPSPLTSAWSPSIVSVNGDHRNHPYIASHGYRQQNAHSPGHFSTNPQLIRTSTLQQTNGMGQAPAFNPYAMYPTKAVLKLNGDLDSMTENWTKEERDTKRRLVQFSRAQRGSTISADFAPVSLEDRAPNSICISCIYWDGKDECFVTSVDTIYLLESLVGVRFTVEEKNRIRRNLEGFRPLTVSKAKADSEDFFKVIMGFPAPKPRNIEKDVKVFPWRILTHALKKIIGKYSASYSSTAGALSTPIGSTYASTGAASDSGTEPHTAPSPQSVSDTAAPSAYGPPLAAPAYSTPGDHAGPSMAGTSEIRHGLPAIGQSYHPLGPSSYYSAACPQPSQVGVPAPSTRAWELNSLLSPPLATGAPSSTPVYNYVPYPVSGPHGH